MKKNEELFKKSEVGKKVYIRTKRLLIDAVVFLCASIIYLVYYFLKEHAWYNLTLSIVFLVFAIFFVLICFDIRKKELNKFINKRNK